VTVDDGVHAQNGKSRPWVELVTHALPIVYLLTLMSHWSRWLYNTRDNLRHDYDRFLKIYVHLCNYANCILDF